LHVKTKRKYTVPKNYFKSTYFDVEVPEDEELEVLDIDKALSLCFDNHPETPKIGKYKERCILVLSLEQARILNKVN
jgi:hypothetical protein